jgi:hypothetical protein
MAKNKDYSNTPRDTDKSFMDTLTEIGTAVMEGFRGSQRASQDPNKEAYRAEKRTEQRQKKAYGGRIAKENRRFAREQDTKNMMCGGKAKKKGKK